MVKVRTLVRHGNRCGDKYRKAVDDEYETTESMANKLIALKLVELATWSTPDGFLDRSVPEIVADLATLNAQQLARVRADEVTGKTRKSLIAAIDDLTTSDAGE